MAVFSVHTFQWVVWLWCMVEEEVVICSRTTRRRIQARNALFFTREWICDREEKDGCFSLPRCQRSAATFLRESWWCKWHKYSNPVRSSFPCFLQTQSACLPPTFTFAPRPSVRDKGNIWERKTDTDKWDIAGPDYPILLFIKLALSLSSPTEKGGTTPSATSNLFIRKREKSSLLKIWSEIYFLLSLSLYPYSRLDIATLTHSRNDPSGHKDF